MTTSTRWKSLLTLALLICSTSVFAVTPDEEDEKKCIKPKFRDFAPEAKAEVSPGTEVVFHVNRQAEPTSIGAEARGIKMKLDVRDRKTFYEVHSKLPAEIVDGFVRISIHAKGLEGNCIGQDGWLIKIKPGDGQPAAAPTGKP